MRRKVFNPYAVPKPYMNIQARPAKQFKAEKLKMKAYI